ncbi:MAG: CRISPR-associated helicase Cas3' [Chloroflexi bacterium]|nr:CRISPR-associated helicase Cas3' [Chloroflexota bacterium]
MGRLRRARRPDAGSDRSTPSLRRAGYRSAGEDPGVQHRRGSRMSAEDPAFDAFFARCSGGHRPYAYQREIAVRLFGCAHLDVWAPTGAGKTLAVVTPFLYELLRSERPRWDRLIYVLPLRSLVESIAGEIQRVAGRLGWCALDVRMQTGERPDDAFFSKGRIIVTTYDQLLSGALESPYGLPEMLHNVNAAAVAGALIVFDEYHLMHPQQAFLTAVAHVSQYRTFCRSVWMTATATSPLRAMLGTALEAERICVQPDELNRMPAVAEVERYIQVQATPLTAADVLAAHQERSIVLVNTVARANDLFDEIKAELKQRKQREPVVLLHSRFFPTDRQDIEKQVREIFGEKSTASAILVCTQVIEAGMNISAQVLHTEVAPMSALVQRAGRCARFPKQRGEVRVYPLPAGEAGSRPWLPYERDDVEHSQAALSALREDDSTTGIRLDPTTMQRLVDDAHAATNAQQIRRGWRDRQDEIQHRARLCAVGRQSITVSDLIRQTDGQTIRVVIAYDPIATRLNPYTVEGFGLRRWGLARLFELEHRPVGWRWVPDNVEEWVLLEDPGDLDRAFAVCLHPGVTAYSRTAGLRLGQVGDGESPVRRPRGKDARRPYYREPWARHAREVGQEAAALVAASGTVLLEGLRDERWQIDLAQLTVAARTVGLLHDVGKLQQPWQAWAKRAQRELNSKYVHVEPLAHTDFDREKSEDRAREQKVNAQGRRGPHAAASAWYSASVVVRLLREAPAPVSRQLRAACLAAILGHHGGWIPSTGSEIPALKPLVKEADEALAEATGRQDLPALDGPSGTLTARHRLQRLLDPATRADVWTDWWPIVAYLTRILRLADQRATSLYGGES